MMMMTVEARNVLEQKNHRLFDRDSGEINKQKCTEHVKTNSR